MCLGVPGQVIEIHGEDPLMKMGKVKFGGIWKQVNLAFAPEAKVGDYVIVHVGFAISILNEDDAHRILKTFDELGSSVGSL